MRRGYPIPWISPREEPRFASRLPVHYRNADRIGQGTITNVSLRGWSVCTHDQVRVGEELIFRLPFDDPDNPQCDLRTIVRWVNENGFGVEVLDQSPITQARLRTWVRIMSNAIRWACSPRS